MSVTVVADGPVTTLRLDRPEKLNALDDGIRRSLADALARLRDDADTRVVVLEGSGRAFSAGADLTGGAYEPLDVDWATRRHRAGAWQRVLDDLDRIPQVTVARLHGHVIGGAALLAAACDLRIASPEVTVRIPELAIGIPLTWAGVPLLVREVGLPVTRDWVMTGRAVAADELLRTGFVTRLADTAAGGDAALDEAVRRAADELLAMPAAPLAMTRALTAALGRSHPTMVAGWADADLLSWSFAEPDGRAAAADYARRLRRTDAADPA